MKILKEHYKSFIILIIMIGISIFLYPSLPEKIATHFDISGNPNGYSSKYLAAFMMPIVYLFTIIIVTISVRLSPERYAMKNSQKSLADIIFIVGLLLLGLHIGTLSFSYFRRKYFRQIRTKLLCRDTSSLDNFIRV